MILSQITIYCRNQRGYEVLQFKLTNVVDPEEFVNIKHD